GLFFTVNLASALAWAPVYMLPGFFLGASIELAMPPILLAALVTAGAALLLLLFYSLRHYFKVL
ncbi:MAG: hypothetical protein ACR2PS_18205, partial [Pseudomonadales bacterium]